MDEFLDKVDTLCYEYGYEIWPTVKGWTGEVNENENLVDKDANNNIPKP